MNYLSICSGIEAATQAWHPLGWQPLGFAEIEPFPAAVLAHRHPSVPNLGDFTRYDEWPLQTLLNTDLLVGGTPCQAFSVAGLRQSLQDNRGNLTLTLVKLYDCITHLRHLSGRPPPLLVWENVPGVLNTPDNAFGCFLAALAGENDPLHPPGGRWKNAGYVRGPSRAIAWRILDAQYFGLAQRRRRVFLVAGPRDSFHPEQVLFEQSGLRRDTPPRRETWQNTAPTLAARTKGGGGLGTDAECDGALIPQIANVLTRRMHKGLNTTLDEGQTPIGEINKVNPVNAVNPVPHFPETTNTLRAEGFDASEDGTGRGTPIIAFPEFLSGTQCASTQDLSPSLQSLNPTAIAFNLRGREGGAMPDLDPDNLAVQRAASGGSSRSYIAQAVPPVAYAIQERAGAENPNSGPDGIGIRADDCAYTLEARQTPQSVAAPIPFDLAQITSQANRSQAEPGLPNGTLSKHSDPHVAIAFSARERGDDGRGYDRPPQIFGDVVGSLDTMKPHQVATTENSEPRTENNPHYAVRRLTPTECERLQGFPDHHTQIPWRGKPASDCPDGPRYKALGNSMAVPVMHWIGQRIAGLTPHQSRQ